MRKLIVTVLVLAASFSAAIAATDSLLQGAQNAAPAQAAAARSAAEEPVSLSGALIAAGLLAVGFLATRRRSE